MYRSPDYRTLEEACKLAREEESNVAVSKDGTLDTTSRTRPDRAPFKRAIITFEGAASELRLTTFSDALMDAWDNLRGN
jgi:hypothetical protein